MHFVQPTLRNNHNPPEIFTKTCDKYILNVKKWRIYRKQQIVINDKFIKQTEDQYVRRIRNGEGRNASEDVSHMS